MRFFPHTGPPFEITPSHGGRQAVDRRRDLASRLYGYALQNGHTALHLRGRLFAHSHDSQLHRWDDDEVRATASALTHAHWSFDTRRAKPHPVLRILEAPAEAPPPKAVVLPPPRKRQARKADPSPAATAFQNASRNGTATVCKGPCEACGQA